jgi:YHS domain-containing protein/thioredoxin-related protein
MIFANGNKAVRFLQVFVLTVASMLCQVSVVLADEAWLDNYEKALEEAKRLDKPLLVHISATWCPPCKRMEGEVLHTHEVQQELQSEIIGVKVDRDSRPDLVDKLGAQSIPTDVILDPQGRILSSSVGFRDRGSYVNWMHEVASRHNEAQKIRVTREIAGNAQINNTTKFNKMKQEEKLNFVGLDGYCPYTLKKEHKWIEGNKDFYTIYQDLTYQFSSSEARDLFLEDPDRYVPQLLGCDPVVMWESKRAVVGDTAFGAYYDGRLYLFSNGENRQIFKLDPTRYVRTQQALKIEDLEIQTALK